jgi:hypothetical protein
VVLFPVIAGVSFQPQWPQAKSSWGLGFVANSPQRGHFIVHMVDLASDGALTAGYEESKSHTSAASRKTQGKPLNAR